MPMDMKQVHELEAEMDGLNKAHAQYAPKAQSKLPTAQQQQQQQVRCLRYLEAKAAANMWWWHQTDESGRLGDDPRSPN